MRSQEMPLNRLQPTAIAASASSVAPVKPTRFDEAPPSTVPMIPPAACGRPLPKLCSRRDSSAVLATSRSAKPAAAIHQERGPAGAPARPPAAAPASSRRR
jgi:hypothetical protein